MPFTNPQSSGIFRPRFRRKPKRKPVTIIVGIIAKDGIVMACDSQSSAGNVKRTDSSKISHLRFDSRDVLVAQAGSIELGSMALEILTRKCASGSFDDYRKPADLAQDAIAETKTKFLELNSTGGSDYLNDYFENNEFSFMVAYYYGNPPTPYLYIVSSVPGFATREKNFAAIGCGGTVGEFILSRASVTELECMGALIAAAYTVEEVKKVDSYCGGATKAAVLSPHKVLFSETESKPYIKEMVRTLELLEDDLKGKWHELFLFIAKMVNERWKDLPKS